VDTLSPCLCDWYFPPQQRKDGNRSEQIRVARLIEEVEDWQDIQQNGCHNQQTADVGHERGGEEARGLEALSISWAVVSITACTREFRNFFGVCSKVAH
jgi:hypothetical protein